MKTATTTVMTRISLRVVLPRSPKVQNTNDASSVSLAKYCKSVVAPEKSALSATPASTIASGPMARSFESPRMMTETSILLTNAQTDTRTESASPAVPAPSTIIANAAPKLAPCEMPSVDAEARGLLSIACKMQPVTPRPAPHTMAVYILGRRTPCTTAFMRLSAVPKTPLTSSVTEVE